MKKLYKAIFIFLGSLCVILGVLGIFLPLLPTTVFLLLAAFFYARSSPRFYNWLMDHRWFGEYIRNYHEGKGMTLRDKTVTLTLLWLSIGATTCMVVKPWWGKLLMLVIAAGVTLHILKINTASPSEH